MQKEVDRPTRLLQFVAFVHLPFSFRSLDLFVASLLFRKKIELLDRVMARGHRSASFPLLSACRFVEFDTSIICHVLVYCFLLISIARYILKSPRICF